MSREYSEEYVKELYKKVKPSRIKMLEEVIEEKGIESLYPDINQLKNELEKINLRLERIEISLGLQSIPVNIEEMGEVISKVSDYLKQNKEAYPSDIADSLGLSIVEVMKALQALKNQDKVEEVE